jgi:hypothetical protein
MSDSFDIGPELGDSMFSESIIQTITPRHTVVSWLVCILVLVSGCTAISGGNGGTDAELGAITVENSDETAHTIHVLVERNSEPIYGTAVALDGISPPANESDFGSIDSAILNDSALTSDSANWTIYTRVDTNTSWEPHSLPTEDESACYSVRLKIETDGSVTDFTPDCASWPPTTES